MFPDKQTTSVGTSLVYEQLGAFTVYKLTLLVLFKIRT